MPFTYYGSKHGLATAYPPPATTTIIEPFAGAAGYSCRWATTRHKVILTDLAPEVVTIWNQLRDGGNDLLNHLAKQLIPGNRVTHPLLALCAGGSPGRIKGTVETLVTPYVIAHWKAQRSRINRVLPLLHNWEITCDTYDATPNQRATWFIDPPYQQSGTHGAGQRYLHKDTDLNYDQLATWCKDRKGQVIVCEHQGADWLPFMPLKWQRASQTKGTQSQYRTELMWARTPYLQRSLF